MKKRILALLTIIALVLCLMPPAVAEASTVTASGYCGGEGDGKNLSWTLTEDGTLTITGEGTMKDWYYSGDLPWASYSSSIKAVVVEDNVTTIGDFAFRSCFKLTAVTIPDSVTTIGDWAFGWCDSLTEVTIPDSVTTICDYAFYDCANLTAVTIGDSVTTIGASAFSWCESLATVTIPDSVTAIGIGAFSGCSSLVFFEVDAGNPNYSNDSFGVLFNKDKTLLVAAPGAIETYSIPDSVTTIGAQAFQNCDSLTSVTIPDSVTTIGNSAFNGCTRLTEVTIPDSVTTIGASAFSWCESLTTVTIPDSVTAIGIGAFSSCFSLVFFEVDAGNPNYSNDSFGVLFNKDKTLLVAAPGAIETYSIPDSVTTIGDWAFSYCDDLTEATIPDSVTTIGDYAFYYCTSLASVTIGDSVTTIGECAFYSCYSLTEIRFEGDAPEFGGNSVFLGVTATAYYPAGNETWTDDVMQDYGGNITWVSVDAEGNLGGYCGGEGDGTNLTWTLTEDGVLTISGEGEMADWYYPDNPPWYSYRSDIQSVVIGDFVTTIGVYAFSFCDFTEVTIGEAVTTIGNWAFYSCSSMTAVTIGASVTSIGDYAFNCCYNLPSVTIPASVTTIGESAFMACNSLTTVTIPDSVTTIGDYAFSYCDRLTAIVVDENNPNYSSDSFGVLFNKDKTTLIQAPGAISGAYTIPASVTTIGYAAFQECTALTGVEIPDSVTTIGYDAFSYCSALTTVTIGDSVTTIGGWAFYGCGSLAVVSIGDSVTTIGHCAFFDCESLAEIRFKGDAPTFGENVFYDVTATAYYPAGNETWTDDVMQDYGGTITWEAYETGPAVIASGYCGGEGGGKNLTWTLTEDGVLTISGEGKMADWTSWYVSNAAPWYSYRSDIKSSVIGNTVTSIGNRAFLDCTFLSSVTIPDSVTTIGEETFFDCTALTSVTIPASVTTIGENAFYNCTSLTAITVDEKSPKYSSDSFGVLFNKDKTTLIQAPGAIFGPYIIPSSVATIGNRAFEGCRSLTSITIPDSVTTIGDYAFLDCTSLVSVTIPDSVTTIGEMAFCGYSGGSSLASVTIGNSVTTIGAYAFALCSFLSEIAIPDSVTIIGSAAFYGCTDLASVTIGDSVTTIGENAFYNCTSLATVTIPDSVTAIDNGAFSGCESLTAITVDANNPNYCSDSFGVLFNKDKTLLVAAPGAIETYSIPDSVTTIGDLAFSYCYDLTEVTIPDSVTAIGYLAFYSCYSLTEIHFEGDAPEFGGSNVFWSVTATAYYPAGNETWTDDVMQDYGGTITWVPVGVSVRCDSCTETGTEVTVFVGADMPDAVMGCIALYDKEGRFMRTEMVAGQVSADGTITLTISYTEEEAAQIGRIDAFVMDGSNWVPLCDNWSIEVNF